MLDKNIAGGESVPCSILVLIHLNVIMLDLGTAMNVTEARLVTVCERAILH